MLMRALSVHIAHETAGAARIRHSLRPLNWRGRRVSSTPRAISAARTRNYFRVVPALSRDDSGDGGALPTVIASAATCPPKPWRWRNQSIAPREERMDCFVARAPRNDVLPFENRIE